MTKLNRNLRHGKGYRFIPAKIIGSGLFSSGLSLLKKAASSKMAQDLAKQATKRALNKGISMAANLNNSLISSSANTLGNITGTCAVSKVDKYTRACN